MRELTFVDLSADGSHVILMGNDGQQYTLAIDERLVAAARRDRSRIGQIEIEREGALRPRDIQARIRAGATAEEVASQSGLPLERIRRFEGPVLTERAWVADQARSTELRRPGFTTTLNGLVNRALESHGVEPADLNWDSWRRDDGRWTVQLLVPAGGSEEAEALWVYDGLARTVGWENDLARALTEGEEFDLGVAASRPRLVSVPVTDRDADMESDIDSDIDADTDVDIDSGILDEVAELPEIPEQGDEDSSTDVEGAQIIDLAGGFTRESDDEDLAVDGIDDVMDTDDESENEAAEELAEAEGGLNYDEESYGEEDLTAPSSEPAVPTQSSLEDFLSAEDLGGPAESATESSATESGAAEAEEPIAEETAAGSTKPKRASVPSWDDILFGTKPIGD